MHCLALYNVNRHPAIQNKAGIVIVLPEVMHVLCCILKNSAIQLFYQKLYNCFPKKRPDNLSTKYTTAEFIMSRMCPLLKGSLLLLELM